MKTIYVTLDKNNLVKDWFTEETHGSFKIVDKSTKEEIDKSLFGLEPDKYYYTTSVDKNKTIQLNDKTTSTDYTYYRAKFINNPDCKIPRGVIKFPYELFKKYQLGQKYQYNNKLNKFIEYKEPDEIIMRKRTKEIYNKIQYLSNRKLKDVKNFIAGREIGIEDEERYKNKYELAINNRDELLKGEANKRGLSIEEFKKIIIEKHTEWLDTIYYFSQKLEEFRIVFENMIKEAKTLQDLELIEYKIDILKTLNKKISDEEFNEIINLKNINESVKTIINYKKPNIFVRILNKLFNKNN